ncbi:uncharacterized protein LAESUDRAFT_306264 [Laetiporus sulphureus 93-53]|uniref:Uncharacterized protein n=1 Tax=Laetiporus sulphureus 93-53 TaxID=1314785 RepID=A0A165D8Y7_9APHY|nr:uncharacterized protein LAESUDRAFT_306264 [Laetiporus sulphureus 93-53]KZT04359.1 hypothetical protein LAESUDRAFT_306264 [Laetiporus sulphureus 93-53]
MNCATCGAQNKTFTRINRQKRVICNCSRLSYDKQFSLQQNRAGLRLHSGGRRRRVGGEGQDMRGRSRAQASTRLWRKCHSVLQSLIGCATVRIVSWSEDHSLRGEDVQQSAITSQVIVSSNYILHPITSVCPSIYIPQHSSHLHVIHPFNALSSASGVRACASTMVYSSVAPPASTQNPKGVLDPCFFLYE